MFKIGDIVWFTKSMRLCKVVEIFADGYTVEVIDSGKQLFATESGLELQQAAQQAGVVDASPREAQSDKLSGSRN